MLKIKPKASMTWATMLTIVLLREKFWSLRFEPLTYDMSYYAIHCAPEKKFKTLKIKPKESMIWAIVLTIVLLREKIWSLRIKPLHL